MKTIKQIGKRLVRNAQAVSPIIATLMLVLVAVGSAGAFYAWQTGWQKDNTEQMSDFDAKASMVIGGSSTVLPFSVAAGPMFEQKYPYAKLSFSAGGSGSGIIAVGEGVIDLGASSRYLRQSDWDKYPNLQQYVVGYDAIVMITPSANEVNSLNITQIRAIYYLNQNNDPADPAVDVYPADVQTWRTTPQPVNNWTYYNVVASEVQWGSLAPAPIRNTRVITFERSDLAGTEPVFCDLLLEEDEVQLSELGITADRSGYGNQGVLAALAGEPAGIGFGSFGQSKGAGVHMIPIDFGSGIPVEPTMATISGDEYEAGRPISYITNGQPTGMVKQYLEFVQIPDHNIDICALVDYVSLYA